MTKTQARDIVVMGGSMGSVSVLRAVFGRLPADFPASIFCVRHLAADALPASEWLEGWSGVSIKTALDGARAERSSAYFAPPNQHLLLEPSRMRVLRGPRENGLRPSIDVLFRSAAATYRSRVIAVLVSGTQADGVNGLSAVKRCGGITIVQEPNDASSPELPARALREVGADHVAKADEIAGLLQKLAGEAAGEPPSVPLDVMFEAGVAARAMGTPDQLNRELGAPSPVTCPECDGPIWRMNKPGPMDFRCEVGHGFSAEALLAGQSRALERALWIAFRTLEERRLLIGDMAESARAHGHEVMARSYEQRIEELKEHAAAVRGVLAHGWAELAGEPQTEAQPPSEASLGQQSNPEKS